MPLKLNFVQFKGHKKFIFDTKIRKQHFKFVYVIFMLRPVPSSLIVLAVSSSIIVEVPYNEASHLRDEWEQRLIGLQEDAARLEKAIASIDAQLSGQMPLPQSVSIPANSIKTSKRKKGENLRTIRAYLQRVGVAGATVADISKKTNIHISSCMAVLKRHDDIFAKSANDGLWRMRFKA